MHENSRRNLRPQWQPGQSGNPNGRPISSRTRLTEQFLKDTADTWAEHGATILREMAVKERSKFADLCARLIPRDIELTLRQQLPGGMDPQDWQLHQAKSCSMSWMRCGHTVHR
jgi:Family of unknown function (DUF5681)